MSLTFIETNLIVNDLQSRFMIGFCTAEND